MEMLCFLKILLSLPVELPALQENENKLFIIICATLIIRLIKRGNRSIYYSSTFYHERRKKKTETKLTS